MDTTQPTPFSLGANDITTAVGAALDRNGHAVADLTATYVKHKPDESTLVGFIGTCSQTQTPCAGHALRSWSSSDSGRIEAKSRTFRLTKSSLGPDLTRIDANTLVWGFPNDPMLRRMRWFTEPRKLKRSFETLFQNHQIRSSSTSQVLSYKPQRRLVARINLRLDDTDARDLVVRYTTAPTAQHVVASTNAFLQAGINIARPVGTTLDGHASVTHYLPGDAFTNSTSVDPTTSSEEIIELLAQLPTVPLPHHSRTGPEAIAERRTRELQALSHQHPTAHSCIEAFAKAALPQSELRPSHGDLNLDNLVTTSNGIGLIDLERAQWAPAPFDLTTLLANIEATTLLTQQSSPLADALADHAHSLWNTSAVSWHRGTALVAIATRWHRQLNHTHHIGPLLERATKHLRASTS